jgi:2-polyprenyl-3-methyl-5-hydroxy-6-metoxy-1,4-benzoquinol methylase
MPKAEELSSYIIKGGEEGRARLSVLARVLAPTTEKLLDRFEPLSGLTVIDGGCGGGDVSSNWPSASGRAAG